MYRINQVMRAYGPVYIVENEEGEAMPGEFDSERNAKALAEFLNRGEKNGNAERKDKTAKG